MLSTMGKSIEATGAKNRRIERSFLKTIVGNEPCGGPKPATEVLLRSSEVEFKAGLNLPRPVRLTGDAAEVVLTNGSGRSAELNAVQCVERLYAELRLRALLETERELLEEGGREVIRSGLQEGVKMIV